MMRELGLDSSMLQGVPHKELYVTCCEDLRCLIELVGGSIDRPSLTEEQCRHITGPLVSAFDAACNPIQGATAATAVSAMYFGSELIAATLYSKLSAFLVTLAKEATCPISRQHLAFFLLHIDMDVDHAAKMRDIVVSLATDEGTRLQIASTVESILAARVELCDRFIEAAFPPTGHAVVDSDKLYNRQSQNWVRKGATCLSDFTGRPVVFEMCNPYVSGSHVLDVGCGEGYGARKLITMGARRVLGLDVSGEMIERAKANPRRSPNETYETCDATRIVEKLHKKPATYGLVPGHMLDGGCFDLAIAIFLFNYTTISQMKAIISQIYQTLKPGGHFIFSVPHPFMLNAHGVGNDAAKDDKLKTFSFSKGNAQSDSYFSLRDRKFAGVIRTLDGRDLNVKMTFKSISDYLETLASIGFEVAEMHEARALPEHIKAHPEFFASVKDSPLHIVFDVYKPRESSKIARIPRAITWSNYEKKKAKSFLTVQMPPAIRDELTNFTISTHDEGATEETFCPTDEDAARLSKVAAFASSLRTRLLCESGAVHVLGLDIDRLAEGVNEDTAVGRIKFAYYVLSSLIGKVDGGARGSLFDVIDKGLDPNSSNVLFSVSAAEAPWHTDGASADKSYDGVGLLCVSPASGGGNLHLSNAASALGSLKTKLPKFILHELFRALPRNILEKGNGQGYANGGLLLPFSRNPDLLKLRVHHNAFPIFEVGSSNTDSSSSCGGDDLVRFRYMRQWIESGHFKGNLQMSPLLELAMNALDKALDEEEITNMKMSRGDMLFINNMNFAHARAAFSNDVVESPRHKVRVWFQLHGYA